MKCQKSNIIYMALVLIATLSSVFAQNYHFSNGWHPGKRSYEYSPCQFRRQIKEIVIQMIEDEVNRMVKCDKSNFRDLMGIIQNKGDSNQPDVAIVD